MVFIISFKRFAGLKYETRGTRSTTALVGRQLQSLRVVVAQVGDLYAARHDRAHLVAMIDNFAAPGHEDVVAVNEEGFERFVFGLRIAEVLEVDSRRAWRHVRSHCCGYVCRAGSCGRNQ